MSLIFTISGMSATLTKFAGNDFPRSKPQAAQVEYSNWGNPVGTGPAYLGKHIWAGTAQLDLAEAEAFDRIYEEWDYLRADGQSANILIYDMTEIFQERSARTRSIVPGATPEAFEGTYVKYYAQFHGWFTQPLKKQKQGPWRFVTFAVTETSIVTA